MKDFRDLMVWRKAHCLTLDVYVATLKFPREETYGLTSQMRRCAVSIATNLAEGCGKQGNGEFYRFLNIATGSASELEYQILLAHDLKFFDQAKHEDLTNKAVEVKKMLASLINKVGADRLAG